MQNNLIKFLQDHDHVWFFTGPKTRASLEDERVLCLLSSYLPGHFTLSKTPEGRPVITSLGTSLYLSISHSGDALAVALSIHQEIGLDIELIIERPHRKKISDRYFLANEAKTCLLDFYRSWTAREAFIKLVGGRLFKRLSQINLQPNKSGFLLGLEHLSHQVIFHQHENYLLALCRAQNRKAMIGCGNTKTFSVFGNCAAC